MQASRGHHLYRTFGDTDPFLVRLRVLVEDGVITDVPDSASVKMHIATEPATVINGTARGDSLGYFSFPTNSLKVPLSNVHFEIQVKDGGVVYTIARGTVIESPEIK